MLGQFFLQYRKATTTPECRKGRKKLFISYKPAKSDEIKRATISSWIVKLIRLAYESEGSDPRTRELHKVSAYEVRALSASTSVFRGMTLDTVLQSCTWRSRNTFSDFYLRDMCVHFWMTFLSCPARWLARRIVIVACPAPSTF